MKYAILFVLAGVLFGTLAVSNGGYYWILFWPAISFFTIGLAYLRYEPRVFGKRADGTMARRSLIILLPYIVYVLSVWHVLRFILREDPENQLTDRLSIGRRLLPSEMPKRVDVVVDLTCEFSESHLIRTTLEYQSFPMLDGVAPAPELLVSIVRHLAEQDRHIYIHCAQGHGRTGLVAAALLLIQGSAVDPAAATKLIQTKRPQVRLSKSQTKCLEKAFQLMRERAIATENPVNR